VDVLGDTVVHGRGKVVVDDMLDIGNIKTTSSDAGSNQDRAATGTEGTKSILALALSTVSNMKSVYVPRWNRTGLLHTSEWR
jgi:hypothetical protein